MSMSRSAKWSILLLLCLGAGIFYKLNLSAATGTFLAIALVFEFCFWAGLLKINDKAE